MSSSTEKKEATLCTDSPRLSTKIARSLSLYSGSFNSFASLLSDEVVREREAFARQFMKDVKAKPKDAVVLFEDEMSIDRSHNGGYGWTFAKRLTLRTPQRMYEKRINGFGAVNPLIGKVFRMNTADAKSESLIMFIEMLAMRHRGKIQWTYLDNPPVHRSKVLKK